MKSIRVNLDGEPYSWERIRFEIVPKAVRIVLPDDCPVVKG